MDANDEGAGLGLVEVTSLSFWKLCEDAEFEAIRPVHSECKPLEGAGSLLVRIIYCVLQCGEDRPGRRRWVQGRAGKQFAGGPTRENGQSNRRRWRDKAVSWSRVGNQQTRGSKESDQGLCCQVGPTQIIYSTWRTPPRRRRSTT